MGKKKKFKKVVEWDSNINWDTLWVYIPVALLIIPLMAFSLNSGFFGDSLVGLKWYVIMGGILSSTGILLLAIISIFYLSSLPRRKVHWEEIK